MLTTRHSLAAAVLAAAALLTTAPPVTAAPAEQQATGCARQLEARVDDHLNAITERDLTAYASTLHEDVVLIFPDGSSVEGKDAVVALHDQLFTDGDSWRQDFLDVDSTVSGCRTAWTRVEYTYIAYAPDGTELGRSHALFTLTWTREGGTWLVLADQNTKIS
ncbi:uncharacterized protein (TIGR02246 family) [Knoellia remsis]|uniref:Uncharacterized protein (TIGR02246 family) n=1 Tax=Knoellia remsis TaxID=407159 RepID=A0A2T0UGZ1_9MICO|nr:nuclear transport factor 2 family protein [Knoellia remsis]PRY57126.1 uncharacterized protein (TIGR02246 family) [Knoellia remsis]